MNTVRVTLEDIHPSSWEHPTDARALRSLEAVPLLADIVEWVMGQLSERSLLWVARASSVEVTETQLPKLYALYLEVLSTLDAPDKYPLFVSENPFANAGAIGSANPIIVLNSRILELMDDDELRYVLGHEVGHILSRHVKYRTVLALALQLGNLARTNPFTGLAFAGALSALLAWDRKSELSADRAGLLAAQAPDRVASALMKLAGGSMKGLDIAEFRAQAQRYHNDGEHADTIAKVLNTLGNSHPFPVQRLSEVETWVESGSYEAVLSGEYVRRADLTRAKEDAAADRRRRLDDASRGLKSTAVGVVDGVKGIGGAALGFFRSKGPTRNLEETDLASPSDAGTCVGEQPRDG
jgi:Zn-dependent protease with chaperone function